MYIESARDTFVPRSGPFRQERDRLCRAVSFMYVLLGGMDTCQRNTGQGGGGGRNAVEITRVSQGSAWTVMPDDSRLLQIARPGIIPRGDPVGAKREAGGARGKKYPGGVELTSIAIG